MLRDPALVPLSRQHQHALALCVMIQRTLPANDQGPATNDSLVHHWESEAARLFADEVAYHFTAEETLLFPAAARHAALRPLVAELLAEHAAMRAQVAAAGEHRLGATGLNELTTTLSAHIRREERQLFEELQRLEPAEQLARLGAAMDDYFRSSGMPAESCGLPFSAP
jgi:hemerythrin HHE cation binding domain-containing protein